MMYPGSVREVTSPDYPVQCPPSASSVDWLDGNEMLDSLISGWLRQKPSKTIFHHQNPSSLPEIDPSSVQPYMSLKNETSSMEERFKEAISEEMLEHDEMVRIPPRKRYALNIRVKEIRKAAPRIIEPDEP